MSKRDGHEWEELPRLSDIDCEGQDGKCPNLARWTKVLFACDKSTYDGGCFCDECWENDSENVV